MPVVVTMALVVSGACVGCSDGVLGQCPDVPSTATPSGGPTAVSTHLSAKQRASVHHVTPILSPMQRQQARRWALRSPVVKKVAGEVPVTAGRVIAGYPACGPAEVDHYGVTLHFAQPVKLPLGTPVGQSQAENDMRSLPPIPLSRDWGYSTAWTAWVSVDGTVEKMGQALR
jgi:hypothetical protein